MSWDETCAMDERTKFIAMLLEGERTMSEACRLFGVSRRIGYKWLGRYQELGAAGLIERSRAPHAHPQAVSAQNVARVLAARAAHPSWGPAKLLEWLGRHEPGSWPAASTMGEILKRHGLVKPRRRRHVSPPHSVPLAHATEPNALWCIDFKGQFRTADQRWCYPLTISDGYSRYLLCCRGLHHPRTEPVRRWMERIFREYGLPVAIRSDNGSPFASVGLGGMSRLSMWWIRLGILPERIKPGKPQQNGRHERMHRTLKQDALNPAAANLGAQQQVFDRFRLEYNTDRPHEALGQHRPEQYYRASPRPYPARLPEVQYDTGFEVRRVCHSGEFKWHGQFIYVSQVLKGQPVGLYQVDEASWRVYYGSLLLGRLDTRASARIQPEVLPMSPV